MTLNLSYKLNENFRQKTDVIIISKLKLKNKPPSNEDLKIKCIEIFLIQKN